MIVGYAVSVPCKLLATVDVWRSAVRYPGPRFHAELASGATLILMVFLSVTWESDGRKPSVHSRSRHVFSTSNRRE